MFEKFLHVSLFYQLTSITLLAAVIGIAMQRLRQPLLLAFIFTGLLASPELLGIINKSNLPSLETLAEMGIALLLFMVGLKLDPKLIRTLGPASIVTGILQVSVCTAAGTLLCGLLGFSVRESLFLGFALSFSSTIIVVKLLSDKRSLNSLYGRMALGILIMQDIIVILATVALSAMNGASQTGAGGLWVLAVKLAVLVAAIWGFERLLSRRITHLLAHSAELMVIFAMGFAGVVAATCDYIGLSKELGGLLAGVALAATPISNVLSARLTGLRDFLLLFFFLGIGAHMNLHGLQKEMVAILVLSLFVLLVKPAIIHVIMAFRGYPPRTSFMTGLSLGQISEFSLILAAMGVTTGYIGQTTADLATALGLITISLSTALIVRGSSLYTLMERLIIRYHGTGRKKAEHTQPAAEQKADIILIGLGRYGMALGHEFKKRGFSLLCVDFDPEAVKAAGDAGWPTIYGDAGDPEFPRHLPLQNVQAVVFSFHHTLAGPMMTDLRRTLADNLRALGYTGHIASTSHHAHHDHDLPKHGVDIILYPFEDAAMHAAEKITDVIGAD